MTRLLKGVGLDKAAQLEMSHMSSYILFSVSYGSTLITCSQNTCFCAENRICILKPAIFVRASAELWTFAKGVERKCIAMQIISGAFTMRLNVEKSSWESSLHH